MFWQPIIIALLVRSLIVFLVIIVGQSSPLSKFSSDKFLPIECGFDDHQKGARSPFSLYFFIISVLFLVFDVETVLLFPTPLNINFASSTALNFNIFFFLIVLLLGLIHETRQGALRWA